MCKLPDLWPGLRRHLVTKGSLLSNYDSYPISTSLHFTSSSGSYRFGWQLQGTYLSQCVLSDAQQYHEFTHSQYLNHQCQTKALRTKYAIHTHCSSLITKLRSAESHRSRLENQRSKRWLGRFFRCLQGNIWRWIRTATPSELSYLVTGQHKLMALWGCNQGDQGGQPDEG